MFHRRILSLAVVGSLSAVAAETSAFPEPYDSEKGKNPPMTAVASAKSIQVPDGFHVMVVASEPDVRQPVAMAFDLRGRLWVAENYTYAESGVNFATNLMDRVLILEDADGDGRAERRKVFWDQAQILTSIEPVPGGVYVLCPPRLLFIADANRDDVPDGPPQVVLDGFTTTTGNRHTFANGLKWGPDGWLWGRIGISSGAKIGLPGAPESDRVEMRGGIWRFHPKRGVVEGVSHGTTNPWGLDWNEVGEPFFINTVIGHLWHAVSGAHLERMHGNDVLPRAYALIPQIAENYDALKLMEIAVEFQVILPNYRFQVAKIICERWNWIKSNKCLAAVVLAKISALDKIGFVMDKLHESIKRKVDIEIKK
jgi:glucose/arabinose dehydrogenase